MKRTTIALFFTIAFFSVEAQTWELLNPSPARSFIEDIFMLDSLKGWAVGWNGLVLHTEDFGASWTRQETYTDRLLHQVSFCDDQHGWIATTAGRVLKTSDGGNHWEMINVPGNPYDLTAVCCLSPDTIIVAGTYNKVSRTTDGGLTWNTQSLDRVEIYWPSKVFFPGSGKGYIIGGEQLSETGQIFFTQDQGESWRILETGFDLPYLKDASFINADTGLICSNDSRYIFRTFDAGEDWEMIYNNSIFALNGFNSISLLPGGTGYGLANQAMMQTLDYGDNWDTTYICSFNLHTNTTMDFINREQGLISGSSGVILKTFDAADHFEMTNEGFFNPIASMCLLNENEAWICGSSTGNYIPNRGFAGKTADGGYNWEVFDPISNEQLNDIEFFNSSVGWACGRSGMLIKTEDGGANWFELTSPEEYTLYQIENQQNLLWMAGTQGKIYFSDDWGESWLLQAQREQYIINYLEFPMENIGFAWGKDKDDSESGILIRTIDGGTIWEDCMLENVGMIRNICPLDETKFLMLNNASELFLSNDTGSTWQYLMETPVNAYILNVMSPEVWWVAGGHNVSYTINAGETWVEIILYYPDINQMYSLPTGQQWILAGGNMLYQYFDLTSLEKNDAPPTQGLRISPNPGRDFLVISYEGQTKGGLFLLYDEVGHIVLNKEIRSFPEEIRPVQLPSGSYHYQFFDGEKLSVGTWIKQ